MKFSKNLIAPSIAFLVLASLVVLFMIDHQPENREAEELTYDSTENTTTVTQQFSSARQTTKPSGFKDRLEEPQLVFREPENNAVILRALLARQFSSPSLKVSSPQLDKVINKVLSESWLDPEDKTVRRRIRVVKADFKYPRLRLEEDVSWNAETSQYESRLRVASVADHLMVKPAPGQDIEVVMEQLHGLGFPIRSQSDDILLLEIPDSSNPTAQLDAIEALEALEEFIDFAEPDFLVFPCAAPNDPLYVGGQQWSLENNTDSADSLSDADIDAEQGWSLRTSAPNITVAVLDTGVRYTHEDLVNRMWQDGSGNFGWDAYDDDTDPMDVDGHGTHCAGIIGAEGNNGVGIAGVAWDVQLMAVRFIGTFGGTTSDAIRSMNFARENGADIISASWGGSGYSRGLLAAIEACYAADIPVVTAAGNERWDVDAKPQYPACYQTPNIVTVAATSRTDQLTTFSNYGYTAIDLVAPGKDIISCGIASDSDYRYLSGTSAATPHVAGALALAKAHHGAEPVDNLIIRLLRSVDLVDGLEDKIAYGGRLNLNQLLLSSTTGYSHDFFNTPFVFKYCSGYWCRSNGSLTREPDEDNYSPGTGNRSAWFRWTAPGDGLAQFTGVAHQGGDVSLVAFEGTVRDSLRRIKDNFAERPTDPDQPSALYFYVEKDKTYTISVDSHSSVNQVISAVINFTPGNDMISEAVSIPTGQSFEVQGNNCSASIEPFEYNLPHQNLVQQNSVWWKWTPSESGEYIISTLGSNFDTVLGVYTRNSGSFQTIGVNDSRSLTDDTSRLELNLTGGQEYYIVVASYHKDTSGEISLAGFPKEAIRFLQDPQSQLVRFGDSIELSVVTDTSIEATYEWFGPQGALAGVGNRSRIEIPAAGADDMGDYHVVVRDGESSGTSATATITELALPPRFLFSPQDISVLDGTDIQMFAKTDGLQPITLKWFKEGVEIQTGHLHTIVNSSPENSGIYYVEATNPVGTTQSHPFQVLVSTDTFGPMSHRSPGLPTSLLGTRFINGRHMAFGLLGRLMLSSNGVNWDTPTMPQALGRPEPMDIYDIAYEESLGLYVMVGKDKSGKASSAVSLNGRNWTANPAPLPDWSVLDKVVAGNGVFVGYSTWLANKVYTSTNGVDWTAREYTTAGSENSKQLQNVVFHNGEFIGGGRGMIYRSSDGINWTEHTTPNDGRLLVHNGKLVSFTGTPVSLSTSTDGTTWSAPVACINPPSDLSRITSNGTRFYHAVTSTVGSSADGINWDYRVYNFKPTNPSASNPNLTMFSGLEGNLVAIGTAAIVQGPDYTQLASANNQDLIDLSPIIKIFGNTIYHLDDKGYTFQYTNDLRSWGSYTLGKEIEGDSLMFAQGKYWALNIPTPTATSYLMSGHSPAALSRHAEGTHDSSIDILRTWNGDIYGLNDDQVFKLDVDSNWQVVYIMPKTNSIEKIRGMKTIDRGMMIWSDYGAIYTTLDGTTWVRAQSDEPAYIVADNQHPTVKARYAGPSFCEFNGKAYIYISGTNKLYVADTGFNFTPQQNLNPFSRLTAVPEGLLGIEETTGWYSPDGTTWQQFPIHYRTDFFHHYNGTLLAWSQDGIYQAGIPSSMAPINSVDNLVDYQSVIAGSRFTLEYSVLDPEALFDRVEFYLDGVLVGQSTDAEGLSSLDITEGGERMLEMRSYDQDGQVSSDYWTIQGFRSPPDKVISTSSSGFIGVWENRLQMGIDQELLAKVGDEWLGRNMPFSLTGTEFVFTPDAVFAVGPDMGTYQNVLISEDGINWSGLNYYVDSMKYQDGWLLADTIRHRTGGQFFNLGVSRDGITWYKSSTGNLGSAAGNGVIVGLEGSGFGLSKIKTSTDGETWTTQAELDIYDIQFDSGYFLGTGTTSFYRSANGATWTDLSPGFEDGEVIQNLDAAGGWHYLITKNFNTWYLWISQDNGTTWTKFSNPPLKANQISYAKGIWFCLSQDGLYSSSDGVNWEISISNEEITSGDLPIQKNRGLKFHAHEDGVSLLMSNGLWTTRDGLNWEADTLPQGASSPPLLTEPMIIDASTRIAKVNAGVFISANGANWVKCPVDPGTGNSIRHVAIHNGKILVYAGAFNQPHDLWQSSDGINFTQVALDGDYYFDIFKHDGNRFFIKGDIPNTLYDKFFTSTDGVNWTMLTTPASNNGTIELLNGTLIILDTLNQDIHHSTDGSTWQTTNLNVSNLTYGNGLFLASRNSTMYSGTTIGNLTTVTSDTSPYLSKMTFAGGLFYLKTSSGIWNSLDGHTWQQVFTAINGNMHVTADSIYINDNSSLRPLIAADLQVTAVTGTPGNLAVGANLNASVSLKNVGSLPIPAGTNLRVHGALSRDGLFGNDDDEYTGTYEAVIGTELAVGGTTDLSVTFKLPGLRAGGEFKLVLIVDPEIAEMTRANNADMTKGTLVTVDEYVLNINRNGDGNVNQSLSALRYANGTLVTLSANATKGSGFGGWSGDSVSPLSNITLMMNQNQNLTANFLSSATLQLAIVGHGTVTGWESPGSYPIGATASLTAQPNEGWEFARWAGGSTSTNASINLTVNQNTNLTAIFRQTLNGWKDVHFTAAELSDPSVSGDLVDLDFDGVSNWQEYLHGSNPKDSRSKGLIQKGIDGGFLQMIYTRNAEAESPYALICEGSHNLIDWNAPNFEQRILSVSNGIETIEARMPVGGAENSQGFMRIRYEQH